MMTLGVKPLTLIFLVSIRLGTVLLLSPIEAIRILPIHARLLLVFILSGLMVSSISLPSINLDEISIVLSGLSEFFNGLILSLSLYAAFGVFQIAGQLIDTQMGLNSLAIINPSDHSHDPLSGRLLIMLAVLFFFALDGHLKLIHGLAFSFHIIPPGQLTLFQGLYPLIQQFLFMFSFAFILASPIVISMMIIDLAGATLTRNMPQMSAYFLTLPIKIMVGFAIFGLLLTEINPLMENGFTMCFQAFSGVMS